MTIQSVLRTALVCALFSCLAAAQCLPATGSKITAGDLAIAAPGFRAVPASQIIGFAPEPGVRRTFAVAELERIAKRYSVPTEGLSEVCLEVPRTERDRSELLEAMRSELPPTVDLQILDAANGPQPAGKLSFPGTGLEPPAQDGSQIWRGHIQYAEARKAVIWARVRLTRRIQAVVAVRDLEANKPVPAESLAMESRAVPLTRDEPAVSVAEIAGRLLRRPLKAGSLLYASSTEQPASVKRGDAVRVEVQSGATKLLFEAVAERQGRDGESIELRNPSSGKLFRAKLQGAKAVIRL